MVFPLTCSKMWETDESICMMDTPVLFGSQQSVAHEAKPSANGMSGLPTGRDCIYGVVGHEIHPSIAMCSAQFPW